MVRGHGGEDERGDARLGVYVDACVRDGGGGEGLVEEFDGLGLEGYCFEGVGIC